MNREEIIAYWKVEAEESLQVARHLSEKRIILSPCSLAIWQWKKY